MAKGYAGKVLRVDLSNGEVWTEEPSEDIYRSYVGGNGLVGCYLSNEACQTIQESHSVTYDA